MKRVAIAILLSFPIYLFSQTIISGGNVSGVWNKCNSPYLIEGNSTIEIGDTLLIEAGTTVIFDPSVYLTIHGHLIANGETQDSVYILSNSLLTNKEPMIGQLFFQAQTGNVSSFSYSNISNVNIESTNDPSTINFNSCFIQESEMFFWPGDINIWNCKIANSKIDMVEVNIDVKHSEFSGSPIWCYNHQVDHFVFEDFVLENASGLEVEDANIRLSNGIIRNNSSLVLITDPGSNGGGLVDNLLYENNNLGIISASFSLQLKNSTIRNNQNGGVIIDGGYVNIDNCIIENNTADYGAGISIGDGAYKIQNSIIRNNTALYNGGGLRLSVLYSNQDLLISNCEIYGNEAVDGGGIWMDYVQFNVKLTNCIIYENGSTNRGAGIYLDEYVGGLEFNNLTIVDNIAGTEGGGIYIEDHTINPPEVTYPNNIIWGNIPDQIAGYNFDIYNFEYSNIENGWPGIGNIDADPLYTDPANGDYSLSWTNFPSIDATKSPCIDTGDPASALDPDGTTVDIGAYYFNQSEPYEPIIVSITDIPSDQGLEVVINWKASVTDDPIYNEISHYSIWREVQDSKSSWTYMGTVTANYSSEYTFVAPTLSDSTNIGIPWYTFKVIAETSDPEIYFECEPDSGYSVDNIAPLTPTGLTGTWNNNKVTLNWDVSPDGDFDHFNIYKRDLLSSGPLFYIISTTNNTYADVWFEYANVEYKVTSIDINGNESDPGSTWQATVTPGFFVDIKLMLEGPFYGSSMTTILNDNNVIPLSQPYNVSPWNYNGTESVTSIPIPEIVDWILLELRQAPYVDYATSSVVVAKQAAFLKNNGDVVAIDGISLPRFDISPSDDYYLVIWHRNHLGILSAQPITITDENMSLDFTTGPDKYYHNTQGTKELSPGIWGMIAADINGDGVVDELDKNAGWNLDAGKFGYLFSDVNLDALTNNNDKNQVLYLNTFLESQIPGTYQFNCGTPLYDYRDGNYYATVQIGDQCWMAESLNIGEMICGIDDQLDNGIIEKYCYENLPEYCDTMGGLYQWDEMMSYSIISGTQGICPAGWHIATDNDWCELEDFVDTGSIDCAEIAWKGTDVGYRLKSGDGWLNNGNGGDDFGFTAFPAGYRSSTDGNFYRLSIGSYVWSSDENDLNTAWRTGMEYNYSSVNKAFQLKSDGRSVRCIKD